MLLIKTELRASEIHGLGCFSLENIKQGQKLWVFDSHIDTRFDVNEIALLPVVASEYVKTYAFEELFEEKLVFTLCGDNAKYMNHADKPNVITSPEEEEFEIAAMDISIGDELTCNYHSFDLSVDVKLDLAGNS